MKPKTKDLILKILIALTFLLFAYALGVILRHTLPDNVIDAIKRFFWRQLMKEETKDLILSVIIVLIFYLICIRGKLYYCLCTSKKYIRVSEKSLMYKVKN